MRVPFQRLTISGREAVYNETVGLCFVGDLTLCLADTTGELGPAGPGSPISPQLRQLAEAIKPAADLADRSTWPTGLEAVPR